MNEAGIRDLLAADLSVLEDGLELLDIEQYIPAGEFGTRNFLDILAKDRAGQWVIIEVKKTDAAAREAAHEVFKYVEAVRRHFGVRPDEIRAIVAAVEWRELLVPFSGLLSDTNIAVQGVRLTLDAAGVAMAKVEKVEPLALTQGRYLAPWHEINLYTDQASFELGIASYDAALKDKSILDYVLVVLRPAEDFNDNAAASVAAAIENMRAMFGDEAGDMEPFTVPELDRYEFMIYFSPQLMSREFCLSLLARAPETLEEAEAFLDGAEPDAELCSLHEYVYDLEPSPHRDHLEIGYAAKFAHKILGDEGWVVERVIRRGAFERNTLLSDDAIVEELRGSTGSSNQAFKREIWFDNPAHIASAKKGAREALRTNPAWQEQFRRVLDEAVAAWPKGSAEINVFNPSSGVFSFYFMVTDPPAMSHMPSYQVVVKDDAGKVRVIFVGLLVPNGEEASNLQEILDKYYGGRLGQLMFLASAGFFETRDADVMDDLGLTYRTFKLDDPAETPKWFTWKDDRWKAFSPTLPFQPLQPWFDENGPLVSEIVEGIGSRMLGGFHDMS